MAVIRTAAAVGALVLAVLAPAASGADEPVGVVAKVTIGTSGSNGWWVSNVTVDFVKSGPVTSSQGCEIVTLSTEGLNASINCTVFGPDGASANTKPVFKIDKTAPTVTAATPTRGPDGNGWYRAPLSVTFSGSDSISGLAGCSSAQYSGPDTSGALVAGSCTDVAGHVAPASFGLKYDATPPDVDAAPERPPDSNGWYRRPVTLTVGGRDGLSGLDGCGAATYGGPDSTGASIVAQCRDAAGNVASRAVGFKYDATPPALSGLAAVPGNRAVSLGWKQSADAASVVVTRRAGSGAASMVYRGPRAGFVDRGLRNGLRYRYTVTALDEAGNAATATASTVVRALTSPADGARVKTPPVLRWYAAPGASYYNVQIFKGRTKVLSTWPVTTKLALGRSWQYRGRAFKLEPGRYRWYVWPGVGARKLGKYGQLLGGSTFVVTR